MGNSKIQIILQARTLSYRLWAKSLLPIANIPLAVLCAKRLGNTGYPVIVAIPKRKIDDELNSTLKKNKIKIFRGSHTNVLDRYIKASSRMNDDDLIIRATADNPFPDGKFIKEMVKLFHELKRQYMCTHEKFFNLPIGLSIQIFRLRDLRKIAKKKLSKLDKEHVVPALASDKINTKYYGQIGTYKKYFTSKKLSVDTIEDYLRVQNIFRKCENPIKERWYKILKSRK